MNTRDLTTVLPTLMSELVNGAPDPHVSTYMLNRADAGLLGSLGRLSASAASAATPGGASIAAHVEHVRYGLSLLNRWAAGEEAPWKDADWTAAWKTTTVSDDQWAALRESLGREARTWIDVLRTPREVDLEQLTWISSSVAHLAYHLGAIRHIDRAARGPSAEDERPYQRA